MRPSVHAVPLGSFASVGHAAFVPSQTSATSHSPTAGRHTALALPAGCWQVSLVPSQVSAVHGLWSSVHAVPLGSFASVGHAAFVPSQTSATSHSPTARLHTALALPAGCWQVSLVPSQVSAVHGLWSSEHAVPLGSFASAGHAAFIPSQTSATSHSPTAGRHTSLALPAGCWQVSPVPAALSILHGLWSSVHAVPLACFASAGHAAFVPSHTSAT